VLIVTSDRVINAPVPGSDVQGCLLDAVAITEKLPHANASLCACWRCLAA